MRELRIRLELAAGSATHDRWDLQLMPDELFEGLTTEEVHEYIATRVNAAMDSLVEG